MLTKDQILKNLKEDPLWEPDDDATEEEWDLFDEAYEEFESQESGLKGQEDPDEPEDEDEDEDDEEEYYYDDEE